MPIGRIIVGVSAVMAATIGCAANGPRAEPIEPNITVDTSHGMALSEDDVSTILDLAERAGVTNIDRVESDTNFPHRSCDVVVVRGTSMGADPTVVRRRYLYVFPIGQLCLVENWDDILELDGWGTSPQSVHDIEKRRVWVDQWHVDITVGEGVSYDTAARLVTALKSGALQVIGGFPVDQLSSVTAASTWVTPEPPHGSGPRHAVYRAQTSSWGGGVSWTVCDEGTRFVALKRGWWIK